MDKKHKIKCRNILQNGSIIIGAIALAIGHRVFVFASFKIPSPSMEPSILAGDYILVNKLILGPRILKNFKFMNGEKVETRRLPGLRNVRRNDVLVFNFPYTDWKRLGFDLNVYYVKRCIAIPEDTFYIDNGIYKVKNCHDTLGCYGNQLRLSQQHDNEINKDIYRCFPYDNRNWNAKYFGPFYVPRADDKVPINIQNINLYRNLISYETDKEIAINADTIFLGGKILKNYKFKLNYYFMSGDYVFDSKDSRYWGLLPEDHIVGKAVIIWKSKDQYSKKYRLDRFFKAIK